MAPDAAVPSAAPTAAGIPTTKENGSAAPDPMTLAMDEIEAVNREAGDNPIKVGLITPLTPPGDALAGVIVTRGARLGAEYVREHGGVLGGRNICLVAANDMASAREDGFERSAVGSMAKLAIVDNVVAALGQWHLRTAGPVAELCEQIGLPLFVENGHPTITHGRRAIFRTYFSNPDRAPLMIDCLAAIGAERIGMIAADTVFGTTIADALEDYGTSKRGMKFLRLDFPQESTLDWREQLAEIKAWGPDAFIDGGVNVIAGGGPVGNTYHILQQAIEVGLLPGPPVMVTFGFPTRSQDYWRMAGSGGNGVMWPASRYRPSWVGLTEIGQWFTSRFIERYGVIPPDTCLSAFTDVTIIGQAIEAAGSADREAILAALESETFDTWRGPVRFERGAEHWHHSPPELVILQYQQVGQTLDEAAIIYPPERANASYVGSHS
jgi:branched-chain amino acid transport system substrate-binding protein